MHRARPSTSWPNRWSSSTAARTCCPRSRRRCSARRPGIEAHLHLEPEHAFGDYRSELVCFEARALFPEKLETGMHFEGLPSGSVTPGMPADLLYAVTEIYPSHVVLDGNHPLAGMALRLQLKVRDVREATRRGNRSRHAGRRRHHGAEHRAAGHAAQH